MLVRVDVRLDVLNNALLLLNVVCEHLKVLCLLDFHHLKEGDTYALVLFSESFMLVKGSNCSSFFLKHHVKLTDPID